jgi:hypothetical protein
LEGLIERIQPLDFLAFLLVDLGNQSRLMALDEAGHERSVAIGLDMDEYAHDVLGSQLVLGRQLAIVPGCIDQEHLAAPLLRPILAQDEEGSRARQRHRRC